MSQREINSDEAIDRLLTGLRNAEPPQGMERRVLEAAQARVAERNGWMDAVLVRSRPWAVAAVGVVILSLAASNALHKKGRIEGTSVKTPIASRAVIQAAQLEEAPAAGRPRRGEVSLPRQNEAKAEVLSAEDALAVSEMNAPSRPAPPLPLTRQEELLAEAVHQAGPEELSSLRAEVRARQMELSKAEFHDFFEPPPAKANE